MVAGEVVEVGGGVGLGDGERNGVAGGVENGGLGGIRRPSEVSGEREEVEEGCDMGDSRVLAIGSATTSAAVINGV
ncbi:hypothetical protein TIFTF001_011325 [Ficus carica]|uniref:Uncharacterized protein n=1 Tax=Ficus carica TaxID=3494 RepID=A0AA87ZY06_FICCA|nr:hypothetical protein TIFTF001_011325 [Ficus carica]